jgi:hypothetical protein
VKLTISMFWICIAILATGCTPDRGPQQTAVAALAQVGEGERVAVALVGAQSIEAVSGALYAVDKAVFSQPGAWAMIDQANHIAWFFAPAGKTASGSPYFIGAAVDTARLVLVNGNSILVDYYGIDPRAMTNREEIERLLVARGFVRLTPAVAPTLVSSLRLACSFLKNLGTSISDVMVIPIYMLTPDVYLPYCDREIMCNELPQN